MKRIIALLLSTVMAFSMTACGKSDTTDEPETSGIVEETEMDENSTVSAPAEVDVPENFVLVKGGVLQIGSPEDEAWRSDDESQHTVTVSDFYMRQYELTQAEHEAVIGNNPSNFSGADLPVENVTWLEVVAYCNARSEQEGLMAVYMINGGKVEGELRPQCKRLQSAD